MMREDPRRRFTFGITMEDTETRFWFASRSTVLVTELKLFISLTCACFFLTPMFVSKPGISGLHQAHPFCGLSIPRH